MLRASPSMNRGWLERSRVPVEENEAQRREWFSVLVPREPSQVPWVGHLLTPGSGPVQRGL